MTSAQKQKTNRANAEASTGPRTAHGKARTARNAHRHGLSLSVVSDPVLSEQVEAAAREIAGAEADDEIYQLARRVAEAQVDLQRVRYACHQFLTCKLNEPFYDTDANTRKKVAVLDNYLRPNAPEISIVDPEKFILGSMPQGLHKLAVILLQEDQLLAMDRYER